MSIITALEGNALASAISVGRSFLDEAVGYRWGVYTKEGKNLFPLAKITGMSLNATASVAQAPLEDGGFMPYNKVIASQQWSLTAVFMKDSLGAAGDQSKVIKKLENLRRDSSRIILRMPGYKSSDATLIGYEFERTAQSGCDLLIVRMTLQEVRFGVKRRVVMKNGKLVEPDNMGEKVPQKIS